ncbi:ion channel nompc [Penicillium angulare]|uniref:Ion channel nompc n=1 Tax=Penicillium angulare TaxID=116970 RepID=A0A9W9JVY7_9EURO|nr:ion channel nompc [Penicillium angulare]
MNISALPTELVLAIIKCIRSKADVAHFGQTSRNIYGLAMPELFRQSYQDNKTDTLYWAAKHGHSRVVQLFLEANIYLGLDSLSPYMNCALLLSAQHGQTSVANTLLSMEGVDPDNRDTSSRRTALSYASQRACFDIVKLLLETNTVDLNSKDRVFGRSPLIWAVEGPHSDVQCSDDDSFAVIMLLLENGAHIDFLDYDYRSALFWATAKGPGSIALVRFLLQNGARPDGHLSEEQPPIVRSNWRLGLKERGEHLDLIRGCRFPMSLAAWNGHDDLIKILLEYNAKIECTKILGLILNQHPLVCAATKGRLSSARLLMERGACPWTTGNPLSCAAKNGHPEMVQLLLDEMIHHSQITVGDRGDEKFERRECPLDQKTHSPSKSAMLALPDGIKSRSVRVVRSLLTVPGFDINHQCVQNPLMIAVKCEPRNIEIIKALLAVDGIDKRINEQDFEGNKVLTWAYHNECDDEIIQLLTDKGAQGASEPYRSLVERPQDGQHDAPPLRSNGSQIRVSDSWTFQNRIS